MVTIFFEQLQIITVERMAYILSKYKDNPAHPSFAELRRAGPIRVDDTLSNGAGPIRVDDTLSNGAGRWRG